MGEHFCLKWNNYRSSLTATFKSLRDCDEFVDMTLSAEGTNLKAHKVVLSACSPYFRQLLTGLAVWQHPVLFLRDIPLHDLALILEFVYLGEVSVCQANLQSFLKTAGLLRIRGLAGEEGEEEEQQQHSHYHHQEHSRKRKPSPSQQTEKQLEEAHHHHHRKRKSAAGGGGIPEPAVSAKLHCSGGFAAGGVKNGGELVAGSSGNNGGCGSGEELVLKQEPTDPVSCEFPAGIPDLPFVEGVPLIGGDISGEGTSSGGGEKEAATSSSSKDTIEGTVTCLVCRAVLSNTNALYYHMNYVHSTGVQTMDLIRKMTQGQSEVKVKDEGD